MGEMTDDEVFGTKPQPKLEAKSSAGVGSGPPLVTKPQELTDEQVFGQKPKPLISEADLAPQTADEAIKQALGLHAIGVLEQPGQGLYGLASMALSGASAAGTTIKTGVRVGIDRLLGGDKQAVDLGQTFVDEYNRVQGGVSPVFSLGVEGSPAEASSERFLRLPTPQPITPQGHAITEKLNDLITTGIKAFGDDIYTKGIPIFVPGVRVPGTQELPVVGALAETLATLATFMAGAPSKGKPTPGAKPSPVKLTPDQVIAQFDKQYPQTAAGISVSNFGDGKISPLLKATEASDPVATGMVKVWDAVDKALDNELGVGNILPGQGEFDVLSSVKASSPADKIRLLIMKYGPEIPPEQQMQLANAYVQKFNELQKYQNDIAEARPKLPAPGRLAITVDAEGNAITPVVRRSLQDFYDTEQSRLAEWTRQGESPSSSGPVRIPDNPQFDMSPSAWSTKKGGQPPAKPELSLVPVEEKTAARNKTINDIFGQAGAIDITLLTPGLRALKQDLAKVEGVLKDATGAIIIFRGGNAIEVDKAAMSKRQALGHGQYAAAYGADNPFAASSFTHVHDPFSFEAINPAKVFPFVIRDGVEVIEYQDVNPHSGTFSYADFDYQASRLGPNQVLVARNSTDVGDAGVWHPAAEAKYDQYAWSDPNVVVPIFEAKAKGAVEKIQTEPKGLAPHSTRTHWNLPKGSQGWELAEPSDEMLPHYKHDSGAIIFETADSTWNLSTKDGGNTIASGPTPEALMAYFQKNKIGGQFKEDLDFTQDPFGMPGELVPKDSYDYTSGKEKYPAPPGKVWAKQTGAIDSSLLGGGKKEATTSTPKEVLKEAATKAWIPKNPNEAADGALKVVDKIYTNMEKSQEIRATDVMKQLRRIIVDSAYDFEKGFMKAGPAGQRAAMQWNIQHNAQMRAKDRYGPAIDNTFGSLSKDETTQAQTVLYLRRVVQIDESRGINTVEHPLNPDTGKPLTGPEARAALDKLQLSLGEEKFQKAWDVSDKVFREEKMSAVRLQESGEISVDEVKKLLNGDYTVPEYINAIDPSIPVASKNKEMPKAMSSSGMGKNRVDVDSLDAATIMEDGIARTESRIARGNTLRAIYALAKESPDNGIVKLGVKTVKGEPQPPPEGWTAIGVKVDGKQEYVMMRDDLASQYLEKADIFLYKPLVRLGAAEVTMASILRTVSGSSMLRTTTTTMNPAFILKGLPMDIFHLWMATPGMDAGGVYSAWFPKFAMQMTGNLVATMKDAWKHEGVWKEAMQQGMGNTFMTHELGASGPGKILPKEAQNFWEKTREILSYVNETQDVWVRLAHRDQLIKAGVAPEQATAMAVQRLRYGRSGIVTKWIDTVIPWASVGVNATSKVIENAAADPKGSMIKVANITALAAAVKLANMMMSPETDKAISADDQARGLSLSFGDQKFILDADGNKRYFYITFQVDQTLMPFVAAVNGGLDKAEYGYIPDDMMKGTVSRVSPLSTLFPPTLEGWREYMDNYDPQRDSPIYNGLKVKPEDQIRTFAQGKPTSRLGTAVGQATGLSPMGLDAAASKVVNTNNFYLQLMSGADKLLFSGMNPREQAQIGVTLMETVPGLRSIIKLTTPATQLVKNLDKAAQEANSKLVNEIRGLDEIMFKFNRGDATKTDITDYIKQQPPEKAKALEDHAKYGYAVDQIMKKFEVNGSPDTRGWWIASNKAPAEARAQVFYNVWISQDQDNRKRLWGIASALTSRGTGYVSDDFRRELDKQIKLLGTERR